MFFDFSYRIVGTAVVVDKDMLYANYFVKSNPFDNVGRLVFANCNYCQTAGFIIFPFRYKT